MTRAAIIALVALSLLVTQTTTADAAIDFATGVTPTCSGSLESPTTCAQVSDGNGSTVSIILGSFGAAFKGYEWDMGVGLAIATVAVHMPCSFFPSGDPGHLYRLGTSYLLYASNVNTWPGSGSTSVAHVTPTTPWCGTSDYTASVSTGSSAFRYWFLIIDGDADQTGCSGYCGQAVERASLYGLSSPVAAGPAFASVFVCEDGTVTCDASQPAKWSPPAHDFVIAVNLADTGATNDCALRVADLEGANYTDLGNFGPYSVVAGMQTTIGPTWSSTSATLTNAEPIRVTCVDNGNPLKVATWVLTLGYDGSVGGASNRAIRVVPGSTFAPVSDVSDVPLAVVFNAWSDLIGAYQVRAPFVFIDPAVRAVTGTIANVRTAMLPAASGHYGPTTCPGYTFALTSDVFPAIRYPTRTPNAANTATPIPTATGGGWPSGNPLPSFTVLQCSDFAPVTGISWWHQVRGLMDYGLLVSYGLIWLRRLQPRFQAAA